MSAFYDLKKRNDKKWKKHRRDILKLSLLLTGSEKIKLIGRMVQDFNAFIMHLERDIDKKTLKSIVNKLPVEKEQILETLQQVYQK